MTNQCEVLLDSYRLAQYVNHVVCYICSGENLPDAETCRHCYAPLALARQASKKKQQPQFLALLGASGVGKTVYLGMLMDMLSRQNPSPLQVLARGAFSITLQQTTMAALARCEFPQKTPNEPDQWNWVHCLVKGPGRKAETEIMLPDVAGEAIMQEVTHPNSVPALRALLEKCQGILLLVDATKLSEGRQEQEHFGMKLLSFLRELGISAKQPQTPTPVAVVFTKADQLEACFDDPTEFATRHASGMTRLSGECFRNLKFFASGVAGACAFRSGQHQQRQRIPLRIEPRGIREPFEWLIEKMATVKR